MTFSMTPKTAAGELFYAAAASHIPDLQIRSAKADKAGAVDEEIYKGLFSSGLASAFVPAELGGFGLNSVHDWILGIATLARGDASTAIAINMHLGVSRGMALGYYGLQAQGKPVAGMAKTLQQIVAGDMLVCATATEPGTDNLHPLTEAVADADGWVINGRKIFVTLSPIATHLGMNLRMRDEQGDHLVTTMLPIDTPGLIPQNDWDALGMRGSGSQAVVFENVRVPHAAVRKLGRWGQWGVGILMNRALANLPLVGAFLGIAEAAYDMALSKLESQKRLGELVKTHSGVQNLVGEMAIELAQCRTILAAAGLQMDAFIAQHRGQAPTLEAAHELMSEYQMAKWTVNRGAIDIVNKAMDLMGGSGYMNNQPLAQLYRDVRAGPFMQPFAPNEAREYIGKVVLGEYPDF